MSDFAQLLDVDAAAVGQRHRRRPEARVVGDREVDLVLGRHARLEGHAVGLGGGVAVAVLGEIEPLLLGQRLRRSVALPISPALPFLPTPPRNTRLDEDQAVAVDQVLDLVFGRVRAEHLGRGKVDVGAAVRAVSIPVSCMSSSCGS